MRGGQEELLFALIAGSKNEGAGVAIHHFPARGGELAHLV